MPLSSDRFSYPQETYLLEGQANQAATPGVPARVSVDRRHLNSDSASTLSSGVMYSVAVPLLAGDVVTNIGVQFGATAASTPTHWWFALYSNAATPALLAQTADQTTGAIAANSFKSLALATAQAVTATGVYYVAIMVAASTVPSLTVSAVPVGASAAGLSGSAILAQTSGSALTTTAPATITSATTVANVAHVVCS